jgi:putative hydrolase of the HAD superfamily
MWRGALTQVLDEHEPGHHVTSEMIRPLLRDGFPWDRSETPHPQLSEPDTWWEHVEQLLVRAYEGVGIASDRAQTLGRLVRARYVDARDWQLFGETIPVLTSLRERGWRHVILSNHVPELGSIVTGLGLGELIDEIVNSAETGYEKPHPEAFALARRIAGDPDVVWMVGDNPQADVAGAEAVGIPAILVVRAGELAGKRHVRTLDDVPRFLDADRR